MFVLTPVSVRLSHSPTHTQTDTETHPPTHKHTLSGPLTADVGPVNGRCWATFGNFVCLARWRQTSGPSMADVGLPLGILSVWPVDGRCRATFGNIVCLAYWRQTSGPSTADVVPINGRWQFAVVWLPTNAGVDFVERRQKSLHQKQQQNRDKLDFLQSDLSKRHG